jgi:hypothetical protein
MFGYAGLRILENPIIVQYFLKIRVSAKEYQFVLQLGLASPSCRTHGTKISPAWFTVTEQRSLLPIPNPDTHPLIGLKVFHCVARDEPGKPGEESSRDPLDDDKHNILLLVQIGPILSKYRRQSSDSHCPSMIFNATKGRFVRSLGSGRERNQIHTGKLVDR